jgi:hypothetical protein
VTLKRREFITALGGAAAAWPLAARAQQAEPIKRLGILRAFTNSEEPSTEDFLKGLGQLGWIEGRNLRVDYRLVVPMLAKLHARTPKASSARGLTSSLHRPPPSCRSLRS